MCEGNQHTLLCIADSKLPLQAPDYIFSFAVFSGLTSREEAVDDRDFFILRLDIYQVNKTRIGGPDLTAWPVLDAISLSCLKTNGKVSGLGFPRVL